VVALVADEQVFERAGAQLTARCGEPGGVQLESLGRGGEDVGGEVVGEPQSPGDQRPDHCFVDAGGAVLAPGGVVRLAPPLQPGWVERQRVAQDRAVVPQQPGRCPVVRPHSPGPERYCQVAVEVFQVGRGEPAQAGGAGRAGGGAGGSPGQEVGDGGEGAADRGDRDPGQPGRERAGQQAVEQFPGRGTVGGGNPGEVQDRSRLMPLEDCWGEHPPVIAEPGGFLQPGAVAQLTPVQHQRARCAGHAGHDGEAGGGCCHGRSRMPSARSSRLSAGMAASAVRTSAGVNSGRT
jgi:hypothetical protein